MTTSGGPKPPPQPCEVNNTIKIEKRRGVVGVSSVE